LLVRCSKCTKKSNEVHILEIQKVPQVDTQNYIYLLFRRYFSLKPPANCDTYGACPEPFKQPAHSFRNARRCPNLDILAEGKNQVERTAKFSVRYMTPGIHQARQVRRSKSGTAGYRCREPVEALSPTVVTSVSYATHA
jgi:hypothetical protein